MYTNILIAGAVIIASIIWYKYFIYYKIGIPKDSIKNEPVTVSYITKNSIDKRRLPKKPNTNGEKEDWCVAVFKSHTKEVYEEILNRGLTIKTNIDFGSHSIYIFYVINSDYYSIIKLYEIDGVNDIERNHIEKSYD